MQPLWYHRSSTWMVTEQEYQYTLYMLPLACHLNCVVYEYFFKKCKSFINVGISQQILQGFHSMSKLKFPNFPRLCLALFPDPSEMQVLVLWRPNF